MDTTRADGVEGDDRTEQHDDGQFDQTNGLADGLEGESDGTADGEERSEAERDGDEEFPALPGTDEDGRGVVLPPPIPR